MRKTISNTKQTDFKYWVEVSGPIEKHFNNFDCYPISNTLAAKILDVDETSLKLSDKDKVHYSRQIGEECIEKIIFGLKNDEIFKEVVTAIDSYSSFMPWVNGMGDSPVDGSKYSLNQAVTITENILREYEENNFYEMVPAWHEALTEALKTFKACKITGEGASYVDDYIEYCEYLFKEMPVLTLHKLEL